MRVRVPDPLDPNLVIRRHETRDEFDAANRLVFEAYVAEGYWQNDETQLARNGWLHSTYRDLFVAVAGGDVVGTVSVIHDSPAGLPSDEFQPAILRSYRRAGGRLAEGSAFAVRRDFPGRRGLHLYLLSCYLQHSFECTHVDRLIQACTPGHARFYADVLRFERVGPITYNDYAHRAAQLLTLTRRDAHRRLFEHYAAAGSSGDMYRFLLLDRHANVALPLGSGVASPGARDVAAGRQRTTDRAATRRTGSRRPMAALRGVGGSGVGSVT